MHRRSAPFLCLLAMLAAAALIAPPGVVRARAALTWYYPLDDIYSTALRFVRLDRGCAITEKDAQAAYLIFECKEGKQVKHGTLELIRQDEGVRGQVRLAEEPEYMEQHWLELLGRKLREERGPNLRPPPRESRDMAPGPDLGG